MAFGARCALQHTTACTLPPKPLVPQGHNTTPLASSQPHGLRSFGMGLRPHPPPVANYTAYPYVTRTCQPMMRHPSSRCQLCSLDSSCTFHIRFVCARVSTLPANDMADRVGEPRRPQQPNAPEVPSQWLELQL